MSNSHIMTEQKHKTPKSGVTTRHFKNTQKNFQAPKDETTAKKLDANQKKLQRLYIDPNKPTISEEQIKMLSSYLKMNHYVDNEILASKSVEEKNEVKQKKQEKVQSDDEESLNTILKELEKDKMPYNNVYFGNNEELKFRAKNNRKKNNKFKNISLQNMDYKITMNGEDFNSPKGTKPGLKDPKNQPNADCYIF
jgi:hypothetical protein